MCSPELSVPHLATPPPVMSQQVSYLEEHLFVLQKADTYFFLMVHVSLGLTRLTSRWSCRSKQFTCLQVWTHLCRITEKYWDEFTKGWLSFLMRRLLFSFSPVNINSVHKHIEIYNHWALEERSAERRLNRSNQVHCWLYFSVYIFYYWCMWLVLNMSFRGNRRETVTHHYHHHHHHQYHRRLLASLKGLLHFFPIAHISTDHLYLNCCVTVSCCFVFTGVTDFRAEPVVFLYLQCFCPIRAQNCSVFNFHLVAVFFLSYIISFSYRLVCMMLHQTLSFPKYKFALSWSVVCNLRPVLVYILKM